MKSHPHHAKELWLYPKGVVFLKDHSDSRIKNGLENNKIRSETSQETPEIILNIKDGLLAYAMIEETERKWAQIPAVLKRDDCQVW